MPETLPVVVCTPTQRMKKQYSSSELADLPGLPSLRGNVIRKAVAEGWQFCQHNGRGSGKEYDYDNLPAQTQAALPKIDRVLEDSLDFNFDGSDGTTCWISNEQNEPPVPIQLALTPAKAVIDLFTRRATLLLSDTSKAEAICQLLATTILKQGIPEGVRTDNGKEYLNRRVKRFLTPLNISTDDLRCLPGHSKQKPFIERFNRTFQHRDLPKLPGFVGHNVAERQALRVNPDWNETVVELAMIPEEFQAWCDAWLVPYEQRPHSRLGIGLEGKLPIEVLVAAAEQGWEMAPIHSPRELDFLMIYINKDGQEDRLPDIKVTETAVDTNLLSWFPGNFTSNGDLKNPSQIPLSYTHGS